MSQDSSFTYADARALIQQASAAPLHNLAHAQQVDKLLNRFAAWYESLQSARETNPEPAKRPGRAKGAAKISDPDPVPAGEDEDVTK